MIYIDVDTAVTVPVNVMPLTDDTDFKTRETGVAYNESGMDLVWNFCTPGGTITQTAVTPTTSGDYDWTHTGDGMYQIEIPASGGASINNDTEGTGYFTGVCDGVLPWRGPDIVFRAAGLNDLLIENAYSTTRGLAGTALPAAAADAAGGLVISDAGGLDIDSVLSGNVPQTGDSYARLGEPAGLSIAADLLIVANATDDLEGRLTAARAGYLDNLNGHTPQTGDSYARIGTNGDGLTAIPWNSAWDAEVQSECADALAAYNVVATTDLPSNFGALGINASGHVSRVTLTDTTTTNTDMRGTDSAYTGTPPTAAQVRAEIDSNSTQLAAIVADTNELQTNQGDWATATGFSTHSAADVWASGTRTLTAFTFAVDVASDGLDSVTLPANIITGTSIAASALDGKGDWNTSTPPTAGSIADAVWDEPQAGHTDAGTFGLYLDSEVSGAGGGSADWTSDEKDQIRYRLQLDGDQTEPADTDLPEVNTKQVNGTAVSAGALSVSVTSPVAADGELTIYAGAEYSDTDGLAIEFTITNYSGPDLTGDAAILRIVTDAAYKAGTLTPLLELTDGVVTANGSTVTIKFEAAEAETDDLLAGIVYPVADCNHRYQVLTDTGSRLVVRVDGACTVKPVIDASS